MIETESHFLSDTQRKKQIGETRNHQRREFLDDAGFLTIRHYRILRVDNPADIADIPLPENHSYIHGPGMQGAEEYVAMFNETWIDHYGFIPLTVQNFLHDINDDPEYNPSLDIVISRADGRFVGFAFCRLEPSDAMLGEVMAIGVRRPTWLSRYRPRA